MSALQLKALLDEAQGKSGGLQDFGAEDFQQPLEILLHSLNEEANLHADGLVRMRERLVGLLLNRLRIEEYFHNYPEIADEIIDAPIFIAALPRSGTTMLHRFIASDPNMYAVLWYECRNPAPLPGSENAQRDPRIAAAEEEVRMMLETYPGLDAIHPMDPVGPDEEIMLMEHSFRSGMPLSMAYVPSYNRWERNVDHGPAYHYLKRLLQFLQWQKKSRGEPGRRWILKAPEHLGYVDALLKVFDDAIVIQSHRDPLQTIPSIASFIWSGWAAYSQNPDKKIAGRLWCERFHDFLYHCMQFRDNSPDARFIDVRYEETLEDPFATAEKVYLGTGMKLKEDTLKIMRDWRARNRREKRAPHNYSLAEYGFSEQQICSEFAEYRQRYILG